MKRTVNRTVLLGLLILSLCLPLVLNACTGASEKKRDPYVFLVGKTAIAVDAEAEPILAALGTPQAISSKPSCLFGEENDTLYLYHDFTLMLYVRDKVSYVYQIVLNSDADGRRTPEGIAVGDSRAAVRERYGEPSAEERGNLRYDAEGMSLYFFFSGDAVTSIEYRRAE